MTSCKEICDSVTSYFHHKLSVKDFPLQDLVSTLQSDFVAFVCQPFLTRMYFHSAVKNHINLRFLGGSIVKYSR